jgi:hypothetical protein
MNEQAAIASKIAGASFGLFLVWVGASFLVQWGPGIGLLGIGVIILGAQLVRTFFDLAAEWFWVIVGALFLAAGASNLSGVPLPWSSLFPIFLIAVGAGLIFSIIRGNQKRR